MRVNAHTTIIGDTVVLVPYRYVFLFNSSEFVAPYLTRYG